MVDLLVCTRERVERLWQQLAEFPAFQSAMRMDSQAGFWQRLEDRHAVFLEVAGGQAMVAALDITPGADATVYFLAWDHKLADKDASFREALTWLFRHGSLRRVTMETPDDMPVVLKLAKRLGFTWEGVKRAGWSGGDVHLNGLLRDEHEHASSSVAA